MSEITDHTAQLDAKLALFNAATTALSGENVDVSFGFRWPFISRDWFSVVDTDGEVDVANVGPRQSANERITLSVSVGSWQPGGDSAAEIAAATRAFYILGKVAAHIRKNDITLGGTVQWCLPGRSSSAGETTDDDSGAGRVTEISADFVALHRIRNA
jgi:hypothetical protein